MSFIPGWLFYFVSCLLYDWSFHISLSEGTLHDDKIHVRFKIANISHALSVPVYWQTDFTLKHVVISYLHDTVARFQTGVKFSRRHNKRGELTPGWLLWWYHVNKCRAMRGNRCELTPVRKLPRCHVNSPSLNVILNSKSLGIKRFVSGISISFKCECHIIMQIQYTKNLNPGRFELGITLS